MGTEGQKKGVVITLVTCAIAFVLMFALINATTVAGVFSYVLGVFSPIIIGFAIAYILNPILRLFEFKVYKKIKHKGLLRGLSIASTYLVALLIFVAFLWLLIPSIITSIVDLVSKYDEYIAGATGFINEIINKFTSNESFAEYVDAQAVNTAVKNFFTTSGDILSTVLKYAVEYGEGLVTGVKNAVLGVFISVYVLISKERLQAQFRKICAAMLPDNKNRRFERYLLLTHRTFSSFFVGKLINAFIIMLLNFLAMLVLGLEYPLLISVIVGVTDIIPIFGPIIGAIPSFFILFIVDPRQALIFVIMVIIIQQIDGNIIGPKILGESTGISSLGVIVAIIVMGEYFGIIGMLVGVPVFAVATTIFKEYFETRLKKRGKATDTAEYYLKDSIVDPHERHVPVGQRIFNNITRTFAKVGKLIFRKKQKTADGEGQETTHQTKENENGEQS